MTDTNKQFIDSYLTTLLDYKPKEICARNLWINLLNVLKRYFKDPNKLKRTCIYEK